MNWIEENDELNVDDVVQTTNKFKSLDELYLFAKQNNEQIVKIVNLRQIGFYSTVAKCIPDWIGESVYDKRLVAYYYKPNTTYAWNRWKRTGLYKEDDCCKGD